MPHDVRLLHTQVRQQGAAVRSMLGDAERAFEVAAPTIATTVISNELVVSIQPGFSEQQPKGVRDECTMDEHDRLSGSRHLVSNVDDPGVTLHFNQCSNRRGGLPRPAATSTL